MPACSVSSSGAPSACCSPCSQQPSRPGVRFASRKIAKSEQLPKLSRNNQLLRGLRIQRFATFVQQASSEFRNQASEFRNRPLQFTLAPYAAIHSGESRGEISAKIRLNAAILIVTLRPRDVPQLLPRVRSWVGM